MVPLSHQCVISDLQRYLGKGSQTNSLFLQQLVLASITDYLKDVDLSAAVIIGNGLAVPKLEMVLAVGPIWMHLG